MTPAPFTFLALLILLCLLYVAHLIDGYRFKKKMERYKDRYPKASKQQRVNKAEVDRLLSVVTGVSF